jgi:hypothetical protein
LVLSAKQLATVSLVRNEADIIDAFIHRHMRWVDRMIIIVHRPEVLKLIANNTEHILRELVSKRSGSLTPASNMWSQK